MHTDNRTSAKIELSIVLISYNTKQITKECIESIYASFERLESDIFELIVLDNASTDGSKEMLSELSNKYSNVTLILNTENVGFGKGNNEAVMKASGKYILFINSDVIVHAGAIDKLLEYFKANENTIYFVGGKLFNKDGTPQASCGPFYNPLVVFGALFLRGDYWGLTRSSPNTSHKVDWVSGACILTKKTYFDNLNGFDTGIFMYMEEIDLLYRASQKGYNTYFHHESHFTHLGSASSDGKTYPILQVYNGFIYFYKKHYSRGYMSALKIMLQLKAATALAIGKVLGNPYLIQTYEKAYKIASMA